jgi:hypothetical protein
MAKQSRAKTMGAASRPIVGFGAGELDYPTPSTSSMRPGAAQHEAARTDRTKALVFVSP